LNLSQKFLENNSTPRRKSGIHANSNSNSNVENRNPKESLKHSETPTEPALTQHVMFHKIAPGTDSDTGTPPKIADKKKSKERKSHQRKRVSHQAQKSPISKSFDSNLTESALVSSGRDRKSTTKTPISKSVDVKYEMDQSISNEKFRQAKTEPLPTEEAFHAKEHTKKVGKSSKRQRRSVDFGSVDFANRSKRIMSEQRTKKIGRKRKRYQR